MQTLPINSSISIHHRNMQTLPTDSSIFIHHRNMQNLPTEVFKTKNHLNASFMKDIFNSVNHSHNT